MPHKHLAASQWGSSSDSSNSFEVLSHDVFSEGVSNTTFMVQFKRLQKDDHSQTKENIQFERYLFKNLSFSKRFKRFAFNSFRFPPFPLSAFVFHILRISSFLTCARSRCGRFFGQTHQAEDEFSEGRRTQTIRKAWKREKEKFSKYILQNMIVLRFV